MSNSYIGEIRLFAGNFAPDGWLLCDGSQLSIANYDTLYALIGTTYGGDGQNTFNLPDLRGAIPVGQGSGTGLSTYSLGQSVGSESVTLNSSQIPPHNHPVVATTGAATTITPGNSLLYGAVTIDAQDGVLGLYTSALPPDVTPVTMANGAVAPAGGNQPHDNTMNTLPLTYIISLTGTYPTQS